MKTGSGAGAKRLLKIVAALALSLLGLALLPLLALPYGSLDWLAYDPAYKGTYGYPPAPTPTPTPVVIPCAELPQPGEPLAAEVNGQGIRLAAFEREMAQFVAALETLGADPASAEFQAQLPAYRRQILELLVEDALVQQAAVEAGIAVAEEEIQARVTEAVEQGGGVEAFQAWLDATDQTWEEFRRDVCQDLLNQAVFEQVTASVGNTAEMVHARQIVVASEQEAVAVLGRLASGDAFDAVAASASLDEPGRERGGDLGWFPRGVGQAAPQVEEAAFAGQTGQVQGPIPVGERYAVIQTIERQADRPLEPEMQDALRAAAFEQWLAAQRQAAQITIYVELDSGP